MSAIDNWIRRGRVLARLAKEAGPVAALAWGRDTLLGRSNPMRITIRGVDVTIRPSSTDAVVVLTSLLGEFDDVFAALPRTKHGLIVDGGGYIGTAAIAFAKAYPDATIVTLEPSPENYALLVKNVSPFANIRPLQVALAPTQGQVSVFDRGTGAWGHSLVSNPEGGRGAVVGEVSTVTIDNILEMHGKSGIDVLKLDIEGAEYDLLTHGDQWVGKVEAICIELHDRIVPGCTTAYEAATSGRTNSKLPGEKYLSVAA